MNVDPDRCGKHGLGVIPRRQAAGMELRFLENADGVPHVFAHGVTAAEVAEVLEDPVEEGAGDDGARVALGRTSGGRFLRVIFARDDDGVGIFVITAYDPGAKPARALRRRLRKRS